MVADGKSGSELERVVLADGSRLVVKHVRLGRDWIGRGTHAGGRVATLWHSGLFALVPPTVEHAVIAVEPEDDGWLVIMRDVAAGLFAPGRLSRGTSRRLLDTAAAMHVAFKPPARTVGGLCPLADLYGLFALVAAELRTPEGSPIPDLIVEGWNRFAEVVPPDVVAAVSAVHTDLSVFAAALLEHSTTVIHGDLKLANLGLLDGRVLVLDWGDLTRSPPGPWTSPGTWPSTPPRRRCADELLDDIRLAAATSMTRMPCSWNREARGTAWLGHGAVGHRRAVRDGASADEPVWSGGPPELAIRWRCGPPREPQPATAGQARARVGVRSSGSCLRRRRRPGVRPAEPPTRRRARTPFRANPRRCRGLGGTGAAPARDRRRRYLQRAACPQPDGPQGARRRRVASLPRWRVRRGRVRLRHQPFPRPRRGDRRDGTRRTGRRPAHLGPARAALRPEADRQRRPGPTGWSCPHRRRLVARRPGNAVGSAEAVGDLLRGAGLRSDARVIEVDVPWPGVDAWLAYRLGIPTAAGLVSDDDQPHVRREVAAAIATLSPAELPWRARLVLGLGRRV